MVLIYPLTRRLQIIVNNFMLPLMFCKSTAKGYFLKTNFIYNFIVIKYNEICYTDAFDDYEFLDL